MPEPILDYQRARHLPDAVPWYRWDWFCATGTLLIIAGFNAALVAIALRVAVFMCFFFPIANAFLMLLLLLCSGLFRSITGGTSTLHTLAVWIGCPLATIADYVFVTAFVARW